MDVYFMKIGVSILDPRWLVRHFCHTCTVWKPQPLEDSCFSLLSLSAEREGRDEVGLWLAACSCGKHHRASRLGNKRRARHRLLQAMLLEKEPQGRGEARPRSVHHRLLSGLSLKQHGSAPPCSQAWLGMYGGLCNLVILATYREW